MKKRTLVAIILLMVGVGCICYPILTDIRDQQHQNQILHQLEQDITKPVKEPTNLVIEDTENFLSTDTKQNSDDNHESIHGIGILTIPKIKLKMPVQEGVTNRILKYAAGHIPSTPKVGDKGNAVLSGHRQYVYGSQFNRLDELEIGDIIQYQDVSGRYFEFEVYEKVTVLPDDTSIFNDGKSESNLTLLTCTPIYKATHRLLVKAKLVKSS